MTKTQRRRQKGIYVNKSHRHRFRNILRILYGDRCCWCNKPMLFPDKGKPMESLEEMATIEHFFSKNAEQPGHLLLLRLSHKKCNR